MRQQRRSLVTSGLLNPGTLGNLELRFTDLSGVVDDPVSTWADSSGNARDATGAGASRPRYSGVNVNNPNSPTGRQGASFDFSEADKLVSASAGAAGFPVTFTNGFTAYAWLFESPFGGANQVIWGTNNSAPALNYSGATQLLGFEDSNSIHESAVTQTTGFHSYVLACYPPNGGGVAKLWQDGTLILTTVWQFTGAAGYTLGNHNALSKPFAGVIYELDVFSQGHTDGTIAAVLAWGEGYWGI